MVSVGYFLSCEEFGPRELVEQARKAEAAGFDRLWISDHFHPWIEEQGQSPFVWSVIGALSEVTSLPITTAVTCPLIRTHPVVVAQAAATAAVQCRGGFTLGVGTGEALNEHVTGEQWPPPPVRLEMLEEAIEIIRALHSGEVVSHRGTHYTVDHARVYTLPERPVPIFVSGFGPAATKLAARAGDGFCTVSPDAELVDLYRREGGGGRLVQGGMKVCWADSEAAGVRTAHQRWRNELLPGKLPSTLPNPADFTAAAELVTEEMVRDQFACGPDPQAHLDKVQAFVDAGFDEVYVQQIGPDQDAFFDGWKADVLPRLSRGA
ncbi:TIGR03557 family F420-dependent LLM class oxidoreductase [Amycolatopsis sp. QT-25]|uniref:TIGR03557 family F420-dependent LLM class oxidoreductase n=1 Tax=Amycolatopsis sp. QT-25 TaxID=3034022 RepID=UPI0023EB3CDD|nr:TIGR03557 family F420-dependent LLM class oxidoreductase [Amycolatopsis sp. QT-25]WET76844.1 TIGR03557 family F420-dependent LLM class oxidoreductase [Amycolatopsis sp. QT-25]